MIIQFLATRKLVISIVKLLFVMLFSVNLEMIAMLSVNIC